jgi:hypothetical protein
MEEDQSQDDQNWRSNAPDKWDMIASGKWIQKAAWNRWVTTREREKPHKTPVTSTWTADFLTREGEGRKAVGDCLRDKTISWKARRRLLQTNAGVFPCEARLTRPRHHRVSAEQCVPPPSPSGNRGPQRMLPTGTRRYEQGSLGEQGLEICFRRNRDLAGEICIGISEYFTPITLDLRTGVV